MRAAQDVDTEDTDTYPDLGALPGIAHVFPARVVPGEPTHQLDRLAGTGLALRAVGPCPDVVGTSSRASAARWPA